ncbi:hypothetical protein NW762_003683 [Fusarium torreyae]|uniref:Uncharacterized protein n=1 Tax=Fusarium torreyae TaxID=1237075 RepID=A0A9W8VLW5_9HYPO|nr:hypothetical protein NW762_003683 [Fusarium torreyae]
MPRRARYSAIYLGGSDSPIPQVVFDGIERRNQQESERIIRDEEAIGLTYLDLVALARGEFDVAVLVKLTTADINTFVRRRKNHIFQRFLVEAVGVSSSCSDCMAMKRVEEWAQDTMFRVVMAARENEADEDAASTSSKVPDEDTASTSSEEPEGDDSASVVKSNDAGEDGPHFEGDDLIAF